MDAMDLDEGDRDARDAAEIARVNVIGRKVSSMASYDRNLRGACDGLKAMVEGLEGLTKRPLSAENRASMKWVYKTFDQAIEQMDILTAQHTNVPGGVDYDENDPGYLARPYCERMMNKKRKAEQHDPAGDWAMGRASARARTDGR